MHGALPQSSPSLCARSWAAYVAGMLVVLKKEEGLELKQGISLLVDSAVPEGKGVSSSAALEVSVMQALLHAHDISMDGHRLATLCQKVCPSCAVEITLCQNDCLHHCLL